MYSSTINIAFASAAPKAVISVAYSGRLSQIVLWNTVTDKLSQATWLKGRVQTLDMSSDGDYFSYFADTFARKVNSFVAVARPPYTTALFFWPCSHLFRVTARFGRDRSLLVDCRPATADVWKGSDEYERPRVEPNCPFNLVLQPSPEQLRAALFPAVKSNWSEMPLGNSESYRSLPTHEEGSPNMMGIDELSEPDRQVIEALNAGRVRRGYIRVWNDHRGRRIFSLYDGLIYALDKPGAEAELLFDLSQQKFESVVPPEWAKTWTTKRPPSEWP